MRNDLAIIVTARMDSRRRYGKTFVDMDGQPFIFWLLNRFSYLDAKVILATTEEETDDELVSFVSLDLNPDPLICLFEWSEWSVFLLSNFCSMVASNQSFDCVLFMYFFVTFLT